MLPTPRVVAKKTTSARSSSKSDPQNRGSGLEILVIRLSSLGDIVLTGPVYRNLKAHWPKARVTVLTKPAFVPFLAGHPAVDDVLPFRSLWSAVRLVRGRRFTHVLDLHANWRSLWIAALSKAPSHARYRKDAVARRMFVLLRSRVPSLERHTLDRYLESLGSWGVPIRHRGPEIRDWNRRTDLPQRHPYQKILVVQTAFLGDAVLTVPLLRAIQRAFPEARLTVVSLPETTEVFREAGVHEVVEDPKRKARGLLGLWRLVHRLRGHDLAIIPHRSLRSALLAYFVGASRRVGFSSSAGSWLLTDVVPFSWLLHDAERNLSLLAPLIGHVRPETTSMGSGFRVKDTGKSENLNPQSSDSESLTAGLQRPLIGMHPGSVWPTKRWLPGRFAEVARCLAEDPGATVLLVGGASDREVVSQIEAEATGDCLNLVGKTDLKHLMELIPKLSLFITNDSGPMHLATSCGVPTLAIFGPTTRELGFFPYGEGHRVLEKDLPCRPCGLHGRHRCPEGHFLCMRLITAAEVVQAAREMLKATATESNC